MQRIESRRKLATVKQRSVDFTSFGIPFSPHFSISCFDSLILFLDLILDSIKWCHSLTLFFDSILFVFILEFLCVFLLVLSFASMRSCGRRSERSERSCNDTNSEPLRESKPPFLCWDIFVWLAFCFALELFNKKHIHFGQGLESRTKQGKPTKNLKISTSRV